MKYHCLFFPLILPLPSSSIFSYNEQYREMIIQSSLSPTTCKDDDNYLSSLGLNCTQHINSDCKQWVYLGYVYGELERNCPVTCNVSCTFIEPPSVSPSQVVSSAPSSQEHRITASTFIEIKSVPGLIIGSTRDFFERTMYRLFSKELLVADPNAFLEQISIETQTLDDDINDDVSNLGIAVEFYYDSTILVQIYSSTLSRLVDDTWFKWKVQDFLLSKQFADELRFHAFFEFCIITSDPQNETRNISKSERQEYATKQEVSSLLIFALISGALAAVSFVTGFCFRGQSEKEVIRGTSTESERNANDWSIFGSTFFNNKNEIENDSSYWNEVQQVQKHIPANEEGIVQASVMNDITTNTFIDHRNQGDCHTKHMNVRKPDVPPMIVVKNMDSKKEYNCSHHENRDDTPFQNVSNFNLQSRPFRNTALSLKEVRSDLNSDNSKIKHRRENSLVSDQSSEVRYLPTPSEIGRRYRHESLYPLSLDLEGKPAQRETSTGIEVIRIKGSSPGRVTFANSHRRGVSFGSNSALSHRRNNSNSTHSISTCASLAEITRNGNKIESDYIGDPDNRRTTQYHSAFDNKSIKGKTIRQFPSVKDRIAYEDINCPSLVSDITNASALTNATKSPSNLRDDFLDESTPKGVIFPPSYSPSRGRSTKASNRHKRSKSDDSFQHTQCYYYTFNAPSAGKLGLVIESSKNRGPTVFSVKDYSPLFGMVQPGDVIVKVNDQMTGHMTTGEITKLLYRMRGKWKQKIKLTVVSYYEKAGFACDKNLNGVDGNNHVRHLLSSEEHLNDHVHMMEQP